jgi:hypothetical protein
LLAARRRGDRIDLLSNCVARLAQRKRIRRIRLLLAKITRWATEQSTGAINLPAVRWHYR